MNMQPTLSLPTFDKAVFVDAMRPCLPNVNWRYNDNCHLHCLPGNEEYLHEFAVRLYLKRQWFQNHGSMPHYDLTTSKRREAIRLGAIYVDTHQLVEHINIWRNYKTALQTNHGNS